MDKCGHLRFQPLILWYIYSNRRLGVHLNVNSWPVFAYLWTGTYLTLQLETPNHWVTTISRNFHLNCLKSDKRALQLGNIGKPSQFLKKSWRHLDRSWVDTRKPKALDPAVRICSGIDQRIRKRMRSTGEEPCGGLFLADAVVINKYIYMYMYICIYTYTAYVCLCTYIYIHTYINTHMYTYRYIYVLCIYVCMYT